jgi:hypothetical protein
VVSVDTRRAASRLSISCCSLPFAASVVPPSSPRLAARTRTERLAEHFTEPLDRPVSSPPSTRREPSRPIPTHPPVARCTDSSDRPPLRLSGAPPPICPAASTPPELSPRIGPWHGCHSSRSAPVGSHHFDGFLRSMGSWPVAARYRTWGSLGFRGAHRCRPKTARTRSTFPPALHPPKVYSSSAAVPHRWVLLPSDRSSRNGCHRPPDEPAWTFLRRKPQYGSRYEKPARCMTGRNFLLPSPLA